MRPTIGILGLSGQSILLRTDHFHRRGETVVAQDLFTEPGGKGYNQAVAAARLGARVRYISCVGDDPEGRACARRMQAEGVDARWALSPRPTALATVLTDAAGENRVTVFPGASQDLDACHVLAQEEWLGECQGLLLQLECPMAALEAALDLAERHHIPVFMNPAPAHPMPRAWLRRFAWLLPNQQEACALFHLPSFDPAAIQKALARLELPRVLVTRGGEGAMVLTPQSVLAWPALPVDPVDTTGAGDTFCAAFAVAILGGTPVEAAVAFAIRAAGRSVAHAHVLDGMPRLEEMEDVAPA